MNLLRFLYSQVGERSLYTPPPQESVGRGGNEPTTVTITLGQ
jgi:hypothetical protein